MSFRFARILDKNQICAEFKLLQSLTSIPQFNCAIDFVDDKKCLIILFKREISNHRFVCKELELLYSFLVSEKSTDFFTSLYSHKTIINLLLEDNTYFIQHETLATKCRFITYHHDGHKYENSILSISLQTESNEQLLLKVINRSRSR